MKLSIRAFHAAIYLFKVSEGEKSMSLDSFCLCFRHKQKRVKSESSSSATEGQSTPIFLIVLDKCS